MVDTCPVPQDLCPITRGDTVPFDVEFLQPDETPMDVTGMTLFFTMELDGALALESFVTFPADAESVAGRGTLKVLPSETDLLSAGKRHKYAFKLTNGPDDVFTVGRGFVKVEDDLTPDVVPGP